MNEKEHPSTYFVQDLSNHDELARLQEQGQLLNRMMGVLPEQPYPAPFTCVLDVACGTGDWLIQMAQIHPTLQKLVGVDISSFMANYAREQALAKQLSSRIEFLVMDALRMLEFFNNTFDLVNHRLAGSFLRTWDWVKLLREYWRVCRPGGTIRVTECDVLESSSVALTQLTRLYQQAFYKAGHFVSPKGDGLTPHLKTYFTRAGIQPIQEYVHTLHFRSGTQEGTIFINDIVQSFRHSQSFLRRWCSVPEDYGIIHQQALEDMHHPDFQATWKLVTIYGQKSD